MAKLMTAECKKCHSKLKLNLDQESAYCPYCGAQIIKDKKTVDLAYNVLEGIFAKDVHGPVEATQVIPSNPDADPIDFVCTHCSGRVKVDSEAEQCFCSRCGKQMVEDKKPANAKPVDLSGLFRKYKKPILIIGAVLLAILVIVEAVGQNKKPEPQPEPDVSGVSDDPTYIKETVREAAPTQKATVPMDETEPTEEPTEAPTEKLTEKPTEKPTEPAEAPIELIGNYDLLQSLYLNIGSDMPPEELESLGEQCGFYISYKDSTEYRTNLYIALDDTPRPDGSYHLDFGVPYIWAYYERQTKDSEPVMKEVSYYFSPSYIHVENRIGENGEGDHYQVMKGLYAVDPAMIYESLESALDDAIRMAEN